MIERYSPPLVLPQRFTSQPQIPVNLRAQIGDAFLPSVSVLRTLKGNPITQTGGEASTIANRIIDAGRARNSSVSGTAAFDQFDSTVIAANTPITWTFVFNVGSVSVATLAYAYTSGGLVAVAIITSANGKLVGLTLGVSGNSSCTTPTGTIVAGVTNRAVLHFRPGVGTILALNGIIYYGAVVADMVLKGDPGLYRVGSSFPSRNSACALFGIEGGAKTDRELVDLSINPWRMFVPKSRIGTYTLEPLRPVEPRRSSLLGMGSTFAKPLVAPYLNVGSKTIVQQQTMRPIAQRWIDRGLKLAYTGQAHVWANGKWSPAEQTGTPKFERTVKGIALNPASGFITAPSVCTQNEQRSIITHLLHYSSLVGRVFQDSVGTGLDNGEGLWLTSGGPYYLRTTTLGAGYNQWVSNAYQAPNNTWYCWGMSHDQSSISNPLWCFVNGNRYGQVTSSGAGAGSFKNGSGNISLGSRQDSTRALNGWLRTMYIFDGYLHSAEHRELALNPDAIYSDRKLDIWTGVPAT